MIIFGINFSTSDLWLLGICGTLVMALVVHHLTLNAQRHNAYINAASTFRSAILGELVGFYPIDQIWDKKEFPQLYKSIPKINSAAAEFRTFVTRKANFDMAINEYNKYCREKKEDKVFALTYPTMGYGGVEEYQKEFKNIVERIISFANEK
jgi:hypothetical protein